MKRIFALLMISMICLTALTACGDKKSETSENAEAPGTFDEATVISSEDYLGDYTADGYTAIVWRNDENKLAVKVTSEVAEQQSTVWTMSGDFDYGHSRIEYEDGTKSIVTYNNEGKEKDTQSEYEGGVGRVAFTDIDHFTWKNNMEGTELSFERMLDEEEE